jgi:hypothetical protein
MKNRSAPSSLRPAAADRYAADMARMIVAILAIGFVPCTHASPEPVGIAHAESGTDSVVWNIDNLDSIGGHATRVVGAPKVIETPEGKAVEFDGIDDGLFVDEHPLRGASAFTWEVIFRPDPDGAPEQRFFHLQERDPGTGKDAATRLLLEIRVVDNSWCLDSYARDEDTGRMLIDREKLHSLGVWHHVAFTYDGKELRHFVDGEPQSAAKFTMKPQGAGHSSIGVRINNVSHFKGAIRLARFTRRALTPEKFLDLSQKQ